MHIFAFLKMYSRCYTTEEGADVRKKKRFRLWEKIPDARLGTQYLACVRLGLHLVNNFGNGARFVDYESGAADTFIAATHKFFGPPHAIGLHGSFVVVYEQRKGEVVVFLEFLVLLGRVGAYAQQCVALRLQLAVGVAQAAGFCRAAGRVVFGVKKQYELFAAKLAEGKGIALFISALNLRRCLTYLKL